MAVETSRRLHYIRGAHNAHANKVRIISVTDLLNEYAAARDRIRALFRNQNIPELDSLVTVSSFRGEIAEILKRRCE